MHQGLLTSGQNMTTYDDVHPSRRHSKWYPSLPGLWDRSGFIQPLLSYKKIPPPMNKFITLPGILGIQDESPSGKLRSIRPHVRGNPNRCHYPGAKISTPKLIILLRLSSICHPQTVKYGGGVSFVEASLVCGFKGKPEGAPLKTHC